jgi:hypothetical protein
LVKILVELITLAVVAAAALCSQDYLQRQAVLEAAVAAVIQGRELRVPLEAEAAAGVDKVAVAAAALES